MKIFITIYSSHSIEDGKTYFHYYVPKDLRVRFNLFGGYKEREIIFDRFMSNMLLSNDIFTDCLFKSLFKIENSLNIFICNHRYFEQILMFVETCNLINHNSDMVLDFEDVLTSSGYSVLSERKIEAVSSMPSRVSDV